MEQVYLKPKPRFEILDGLRGVAALIVVAYHLTECYPEGYTSKFFAHGYLAVDFFFALSGFVMGYAYDDRWNKMNIQDFFKRRITRLHPLVVFGTLMGVCFFYYTGSIELFDKVDSAAWWMVLLQGFLTMCMIPLPVSMDIRGWGEITSINAPIWTLIYEYIANILYALVFRHLNKPALCILVALTAVFTADCCLHLNLWGLLVSDWNSYSVIGGFILNPEHIYIGFARLLYPFLVGLLLSKIGKTINVKNGFFVTSLLITIMLCVPTLGGDNRLLDGIYQLFCILLLFPFILIIGAGSTIKSQKTIRLCSFLGEISYPLYITHFPLMYMHTSWAHRHPDAPLGTHIFVAVTTLFVALGLAWASLKLFDEPVREWLKTQWLEKKHKIKYR